MWVVTAVLALEDGERAPEEVPLLPGVAEIAVCVAEVRQRDGHLAMVTAVLA
eukprot:CAMPEP_0185701216 /NCGR_PEP_ID=MMETSP1164-20130828/8894_1 /TAXON_ID=1104430 /ORGANISM="Chrysoreinhardia sp, Strain CCMP2950" /LENGTH=51 /DNA_ID=CAMNT_0028368235 /DNA_START=158 /DNA_END=309 /DNA_ORIENTATION=-